MLAVISLCYSGALAVSEEESLEEKMKIIIKNITYGCNVW